jgi:3,2-trans-enoyl-CoA isomerase
MDTAFLQQLHLAIRDVEKQKAEEGWGLVIASSQHATSAVFSAGLDLAEMYNKPRASVCAFWTALQDVFLALYGSKLATVCAINGHAPAGGCFLASLSDYRVGASDQPKAVMGLNEAKFGLVAPPWFAGPLANCVGVRQAEKMLQLGELLPLAQAQRLGLLDELVPRAEVVDKSLQVASTWASNGPAQARHSSKLLQRQALLDALSSQRQADTDLFVGRVLAPQVQSALEVYLASLKKR